MNGTIYCLENTLTDKMYVGKTERPFEERMREYALGHGHGYIGRAILKYGWKHFSVKVVEEIPVEDLNEAERFWIAFLDTMAPNGYNLREGGDGGKLADSTKELIREANLRQVADRTHNFITNNPASETTRRRLEEGTHNFLAHTQESIAKRQRTKRNNRPTQDWVDMLQEAPDETR